MAHLVCVCVWLADPSHMSSVHNVCIKGWNHTHLYEVNGTVKYVYVTIVRTASWWSYVLGFCIYKNKNIFEKMSEYVGFSPPPTYFLHIRCDH